jgi:hypothetical protein
VHSSSITQKITKTIEKCFIGFFLFSNVCKRENLNHIDDLPLCCQDEILIEED